MSPKLEHNFLWFQLFWSGLFNSTTCQPVYLSLSAESVSWTVFFSQNKSVKSIFYHAWFISQTIIFNKGAACQQRRSPEHDHNRILGRSVALAPPVTTQTMICHFYQQVQIEHILAFLHPHVSTRAAVSPWRVASSTAAHVGAVRPLSCSNGQQDDDAGDRSGLQSWFFTRRTRKKKREKGERDDRTDERACSTGLAPGRSVICMHTTHPPPVLVREKLPWLCCKLTLFFFWGKLRSSIRIMEVSTPSLYIYQYYWLD